jgi:hypothetical protein
MAGIPPEQERVLALLGMALLTVQHTEFLLQFTLQYTLPGTDGLTLETLERSKNELRKKTLGQFLHILKQRIELDDSFESALDQFLDARNILAHRVTEIPGWNMETPDGQRAAQAWLSALIRIANFIAKVLMALMRSWVRQNGMDNIPIPVGSEEFFTEIDTVYAPAVDTLFFQRE